ncbi:hypothetical protein MMYC01_200666 [Madurella mycetomatis]|uniref:Uncharacterized protein n=1 Tax=Madurella mycetomatis TaxID=100816 RepID=A0A175WHG7_9PEZI|nr:hypothetical protein MMYC01_200666 [Madurella mycetomatis]
MKGRSVDQLVYEYMFPKPRQGDPQNFHAFLHRYLILEVRQETHSFYGHLDTPEAKYPGLDYTHPIHRIRLSRWPWHRRLFRAFDGLRLTPAEISGLTKWEGTKWAKERFEREQGYPIHDTTADGFPNWADPEARGRPLGESQSAGAEETQGPVPQPDENVDEEEEEEQDGDEDDESDGELESVGVALNERLRERVALRNISGDHSMPLDEEWENWLKNAIESGELPHVADQIARFPGQHSRLTADDIFPPRMMAAARRGNWEEIPNFLRDMIRQALESGERSGQATTAATSNARPSGRYTSALGTIARVTIYAPEQRRSYSDVRHPETGDRRAPSQSNTRVRQAAQPGA